MNKWTDALRFEAMLPAVSCITGLADMYYLTEETLLLTCVLTPEGEPVWPPGAVQSSRFVPSCPGAVLGGPGLLRGQPGGGGLRFGT